MVKHLINGDIGKLKLGFFNLIDNAIKYSLKVNGNYKPVYIDEVYNPEKKHLIYIFTNYGEPPEGDVNELFQRNKRGSNSLKYGIDGTGEGLYRCREIFTYHKAFINLFTQNNVEAKKTTVKVTFDLEENKSINTK